jgi:hypothetical protein
MSRTFLTHLVAISLPALLAACATPVEETAAPAEADLQRSSSITVAIDDDGRLFVPDLQGNLERYHNGVHVDASGVVTLENAGHSRRHVVVRFDGPPMLDPNHEIHTSQTADLGPSESVQMHVPRSRGHYSFGCPTASDEVVACRGIVLSDGNEWRPTVGVNSPF